MKQEKTIYDRNLDLRSNTADYFIINSIYNEAKVLELGCSTGYITRYLNQQKKCETSAVEIDIEAINQIKALLKYAINNDLNKIDEWIQQVPNSYFDFIVCQDVLEHLIDPFYVLSKLKFKLKYKGQFLISIPNVSHNTIIMQLLKNKFEYKDLGILDKTHIKFYTKESFSLEANKFQLKRLQHYYTYLIPAGTGWNTEYLDFSLEEREILLNNTDGHIFQNLFAFGCMEDYEDVPEAPFNICNYYSYDEIRIFELNNVFLYYYDDNTVLTHYINEDCKEIFIMPTIRPYEYAIDLKINGVKYNFWCFSVLDGNINSNNGNFINLDSQLVKVDYNFNKGDKIEVVIKRKNNSIKQLIGGKINMTNEVNKLKELVSKYDIISFDIFDTLVLRNVLFPKDIFKLLDMYVENTYNIKNFYSLRINAEMETRINTSLEDITISDIYNTIKNKLSIDVSNIMGKELELENKFIVVNPYMKIIFDYVKKLNKKILIISDMYLTSEFLDTKLKALGYNNYDMLFVSSDIKKTKATKTMYKYILNQFGFNPNSWLHIGDNYQSDVNNPKSFKINSYYYKAVRDRVDSLSKINEESLDIKNSIMKAIQYNKVYCGLEIPYWEKFGIEYIAPIYYGFSDWIARMNKNSDNIVFLSRDGYIPKCVFDKIKVKRNMHSLKSIYLYTSRKAYQLPSMAYMSKGELIEYLTQWNEAFGHKYTISELFKNADLDIEKYWNEINCFGFTSKDDLINFETRHNAKKLVAYLYDDIIDVMKDKCILVEEYLKQEGILDFDIINIVDIGWRGSIQLAIKKLAENYSKDLNSNKKNRIKGFYLGTNQFVYPEIVDDTFGYYFDFSIPWVHSSFCLENIMMYEYIFTCPEPQLSHFVKVENEIVPQFREFIENVEYTSMLQNAALNIIDEFIEFDDYISGIEVEYCTDPYRNFIIEKDYDDMIQFQNISNFVSYDADNKPYVKKYSKVEVINGVDKIWEEIKYNLWRYTYLVEGIESKEEFETFLRINKLKRYPESIDKTKIFTYANLVKSIKHPLKAIKWLIKLSLKKVIA